MTISTGKSAFWTGFRDGLPFMFVVGPFGLLFGVVAAEAGLTVAQAMTMTSLVIAGASQFAAVQLMVENAAFPLILLAALAVNLRMAMYSAALVPWLGQAPLWQRLAVSYLNVDQTYTLAMLRYERDPEMVVRARVVYFFGAATPIIPVWLVFSYVGMRAGTAIPEALALDFALPITFIAMVAPMLRTAAHVAAAGVSVVVGLALSGLPSGLGLLIAAVAAMAAGAMVEARRESTA